MERITQFLKEPQKVSMLLAVLFFVGILFSAYQLFTLTSKLTGGSYDATFVTVALTFVIGVLAIHQAFRIRREVVVFKEKQTTDAQEQATKAEQAFTIDLNTFKNDIKNEKGIKAWQVGLNSLCQLLQAGQGALYQVKSAGKTKTAELTAGFALLLAEGKNASYQSGEGLIGQVVASGKSIYLDELPEGYQQQIVSGLGKAAPKYIFISALKKENETKAILEIATFAHLPEQVRKQAEEMATLLIDKI